MYTYTYTYTYIHTWIHVHKHTHIHVHIQIYIYICLCTYLYIYLYIYRICTFCREREANVYADVHNICLTYTPAHAWCATTPVNTEVTRNRNAFSPFFARVSRKRSSEFEFWRRVRKIERLFPGANLVLRPASVGLGISRTNADSQWNPVHNAFHRNFCYANETIRW